MRDEPTGPDNGGAAVPIGMPQRQPRAQDTPDPSQDPSAQQKKSGTWQKIRPWALGVFFVVVAVLLARLSRSVDWGLAWQAMQSYRPGTLLLAVALAASSHLLYSTFDLLGRRQTGHKLPAPRVMGVAFVSYAFNLNLGSVVGAVAMRFRLYTRLGLSTATITEVLAVSLLTNWLGYLLLGGLVFALRPLQLPPEWKLGSTSLQLLGVLMLLAVAAYLALCWLARQREWTVRGRRFKLPTGRLALVQLVVSSCNWLLISGVIFVLLGDRIDYASVLSVMLIAAIAGVVSHIPAGLGVLEAVFIALLSHRAAPAELLAALLTYRAVYYLGPLALAGAVFLYFNAAASGRGRSQKPA